MSENVPARVAMVVLPLLAACAMLPAGLDRALHPAVAASVPLVWAMTVASVMRSDHAGRGLALVLALPFSAWAIARLAPGEGSRWLGFVAAAAGAGSAWYAAGDKAGSRRLAFALLMASIGLQRFAGPVYALALASLLACLRLARSGRGRGA